MLRLGKFVWDVLIRESSTYPARPGTTPDARAPQASSGNATLEFSAHKKDRAPKQSYCKMIGRQFSFLKGNFSGAGYLKLLGCAGDKGFQRAPTKKYTNHHYTHPDCIQYAIQSFHQRAACPKENSSKKLQVLNAFQCRGGDSYCRTFHHGGGGPDGSKSERNSMLLAIN